MFDRIPRMVWAVPAILSLLGGHGCGGSSDGERTLSSDDELVQIARRSTVFIEASGLVFEVDGTNAQNWMGSGFLISEDGYVVTNNHVVTGAGELKVTVDGTDRPYSAAVVGVAECADLAVIKLTSGSGFPPLSFSPHPPTVGMPVALAGFPGDIHGTYSTPTFTLTQGTVDTEPGLVATQWAYVEAIEHSATGAPGSSGGPLLERATGQVVGVHYAGDSTRNLDISSTAAKPLIAQLREGKNLKAIGATIELAYYANADGTQQTPAGVFVKAVQAGGKASQIGIQPGDLIVMLANVPLILTDQETEQTAQDKYSLAKYCNVLESNDPNSTVIAIEVLRSSTNEVCSGEINGKALSCVPAGGGGGGGGGGGNPTVVNGTLGDGDFVEDDEGQEYYDVYQFTASASGTAEIAMTSTALDAYLQVYDASDNLVAEDNDGGGGTNAKVTFNVTQGSTYLVAAMENERMAGAYNLTFSGNLSDIQEIPPQ